MKNLLDYQELNESGSNGIGYIITYSCIYENVAIANAVAVKGPNFKSISKNLFKAISEIFYIEDEVLKEIDMNEFDDINDGMMIEIKNNKLIISFPDNAEYIIDLGPKKVKDIMSQQSRIFKKNGKLLVKPVTGGSVIIEPFFTVVKKGF